MQKIRVEFVVVFGTVSVVQHDWTEWLGSRRGYSCRCILVGMIESPFLLYTVQSASAGTISFETVERDLLCV